MEQIIVLKTKLIFETEQDKESLIEFLKLEREAFNLCSPICFENRITSIVDLHKRCYHKISKQIPEIKSQLIIKAEQNCLAAYRSIRKNKHNIKTPCIKKRLGSRIDKRLYTRKEHVFRFTTIDKRIECTFEHYDRLDRMLHEHPFGDPILSVQNDDVFICFPFKVKVEPVKPKLALGIDLGIRRFAATSEGKIFIDKKFNAKKRKVRHRKKILKAKATKSAKRRLKKIGSKERQINNDFNHKLANKLLETKANILVLEKLNVAKMKRKKHPNNDKSRISQIGFSNLLFILTYKALLRGKQVITVNPAYTSQIDHVTKRKSGTRVGCRYYTKRGLVYDADVNAANVIAQRSKLPVSCGNVLDGQAIVSSPIVG